MDALLAVVAAAEPAEVPQRLTDEQRWTCVVLKKQGWTAKRIASYLNLRPNTVSGVLARYNATGSPGSGRRSGRPHATDEALDTAIVAHAINEPSRSTCGPVSQHRVKDSFTSSMKHSMLR